MSTTLRTIITHVGSSLLDEHCEAFNGFRDRKNLCDDLASSSHEYMRDTYLDDAAAHLVGQLGTIWGRGAEARFRHSPAEIASLGRLEVTRQDRVVLLHSDTVEGAFCAALLKRALTADGIPHKNDYPMCAPEAVSFERVSGLRVASKPGEEEQIAEAFVRTGLTSYVRIVWQAYRDLYDRWREHGSAVPKPEVAMIFNVTAGYKGTVPVARDLALLLQAYSIQLNRRNRISTAVCYLYEESAQLIRYESLPVQFDWRRVTVPHLTRAAVEDEPVKAPAERQRWDELMPEERHYFEPIEPEKIFARLSPLGRVVWELAKLVDSHMVHAPME
jgi:hypothetical protein